MRNLRERLFQAEQGKSFTAVLWQCAARASLWLIFKHIVREVSYTWSVCANSFLGREPWVLWVWYKRQGCHLCWVSQGSLRKKWCVQLMDVWHLTKRTRSGKSNVNHFPLTTLDLSEQKRDHVHVSKQWFNLPCHSGLPLCAFFSFFLEDSITLLSRWKYKAFVRWEYKDTSKHLLARLQLIAQTHVTIQRTRQGAYLL